MNRAEKLVIDDIRYVSKDGAETSVMFEVVMHRYIDEVGRKPYRNPGWWTTALQTVWPSSTLASASSHPVAPAPLSTGGGPADCCLHNGFVVPVVRWCKRPIPELCC